MSDTNKERLIYANKLMERLTNWKLDCLEHSDFETASVIDDCMCELDAQPTVDAVVLPCKIGDPVWFVGTNNINRLKQGVVETIVEKLILKSGGVYMKLACNAMYETSCRSIGKTVFFTREEAEAALEKMDGDRNV